MQFHSILFDTKVKTDTYAPDSTLLKDTNLDQIIKTIISHKKDFDIEHFFYLLCDNIKTINYRQNVIKDLQRDKFYVKVDEFSQKILKTKRYQKIIKKFDEEIYKKSWFFQMVVEFNKAVLEFLSVLNKSNITSEGFTLLKKYITNYIKSDDFISMQKDMHSLQEELSSITYDITIDGLTFRVKRYENEENYAKDVSELFKEFEQNEQYETLISKNTNENKNHEGFSCQRQSFSERNFGWNSFPIKRRLLNEKIECHYEKNRGTNHVNAKILEFVSKLYPETFKKLDDFYKKHADIIDETILTFSQEVQFYISYINYIEDIKDNSIDFCLPKLQTEEKTVDVKKGFDLALAYNLRNKNEKTVTNDYLFTNGKRIMVVSGANQGGKSTYARAFAQIAYLSKLGLLVPAKEANLYLFDKIFTHFEKEEKVFSLKSKLQEDLTRVHQILLSSTPKTLIILNEIFSSTSFRDALFLSREIINSIDKLDAFCIWVTFIEELNQMSDKCISMVSQVDMNDINKRTYKILPKEADGKAYAATIADKYHLNYEQILQRIEP